MPNWSQFLLGPVVYRPYQTNLLEECGNKLMSIGAGVYNVFVMLSPILVPYFAYSHSHNYSLLRAVVVFYAVAFATRTMGRLINAEYVRFIELLVKVRHSPQNVNLRDQLKHYDFQVSAAPVDFRASPCRATKWHAPPPEIFPDLVQPLGWLRQAIAWSAANTFGRRILFPGSMSLFHSLLNDQLLQGRRKLMTEMGGIRNIIGTEDGNKVDSMFIDKRGKGANGDILVICCEGNAGYYEMGIMASPVQLGYSVLGWNLPGFAESDGSPLPHIIIGSMEATMQFAVRRLGFQPKQIVLFGWSIGGFPATWAAANYPEIKALILDASFDDLVPLALHRMPSALEHLVRFTVRKHLNLPIAQQLQRYEGPVLLIRRWNDEIIATEVMADEATKRASNRINYLLISLLRNRHPGLVRTLADEECVFEWLSYDPETRLVLYPQDYSLDPSTIRMEDEHNRHRLIRQLCTKYFVDFMDATHNVPLDVEHFQIPSTL